MKLHPLFSATALILVAALTSPSAQAQGPGLTRTALLRNDLSTSGREAIQVLVGFASGSEAPRHAHPGEELVYVLEGVLEYHLDGRDPITLRPGEVLFIPAGTPHAVKNVGAGKASELATYIVEKGKPLLVPSE